MRISFTDLGMEGRLTGVRLELLAYLLPIIGRKDGSQTAGSLCGAYIMYQSGNRRETGSSSGDRYTAIDT